MFLFAWAEYLFTQEETASVMLKRVRERLSLSHFPFYRNCQSIHTVSTPWCSHLQGTHTVVKRRFPLSYETNIRELAFQISDQFAALGAPLNIQTAVIVGGMDMIAQAIELNNRPHVIVATPGRIVDHLKSSSGEWDLSRVKFLVCPTSMGHYIVHKLKCNAGS